MKSIRTIVQYIKATAAKDGFIFRLVLAILQFMIVLAFIVIILSIISNLQYK